MDPISNEEHHVIGLECYFFAQGVLASPFQAQRKTFAHHSFFDVPLMVEDEALLPGTTVLDGASLMIQNAEKQSHKLRVWRFIK